MPSESRRHRPVSCAEAAAVLPAMVDNQQVDRRLRTHVGTCLRCQAELAQYRRLRRNLRRLEHEVIEPGPGVLVDVMASLAGAELTSSGEGARKRAVALSGVAVGGVAVATAAGALVWASRRRVGLAS